ncbi:MAG TPA: permease prefix domain 1-containing protein [Candidatus Methylacidiphilales bacterium]|jgi:hypothetical protein|nr:permease prefix domain 1-containing protein [Candidatus Methylacidiphilales bacterium]
MKSLIDRYIDRVLLVANLPQEKSAAIRRELKDHLLQKTEDLIASGTPREEATLEALRLHGSPRDIGYHLRGPFPWIDIRIRGTARGVIAIGPKAVGIFAFGGFATGVFAFGGVACGLFSAGGFALGLLFAFAGFGMGGVAYGGFTMGIVAAGGYVAGIVAVGGEGSALWVPWLAHGSSGVHSYYTAANVPPLLKSLARLMEFPETLNRYPQIVWPLYGLALFLMSWMQTRERKRIRSDFDWMVDDE